MAGWRDLDAVDGEMKKLGEMKKCRDSANSWNFLLIFHQMNRQSVEVMRKTLRDGVMIRWMARGRCVALWVKGGDVSACVEGWGGRRGWGLG